MKLICPAFQQMGQIPSKFTCDGENINPPFEFQEVPPNAKSLVICMEDPDAPAGIWVHWIVFNMPVAVTKIEEGQVSYGVLAKNSFGEVAYGGPCPPSGTHRYIFSLYALDTVLDAELVNDKHSLDKAMKDHVIDQVQYVGLYSKLT